MTRTFTPVRVGVCAVAAVAGLLLGSWSGDGSAQTTTDTAVTTSPTGPETTTAETETQTETVTTTAETVTTVETTVTIVPPATATDEESTEDEVPWAWIAGGAAVAAAALGGLLLWRRQRAKAASWSARMTHLSRRSLVATDDVLAQGSLVTGQIEALADEARALEERAPDDESAASAGPLRASLEDLAGVLEADRTLQYSSPPPSPEQLAYSSALIQQKVAQLQDVLRGSRP
jgi:hypothetical protein